MTRSIKKAILIIAIHLSAIAAYAQSPATIVGQWRDETRPDVQMEFYLDQDGLYYAKTINSKTEEIVNGFVVLKKLRFNAATKKYIGIMSPPDADIQFNAIVTIVHNNKLKIVAKKMILSKTIFLVRI